MDQAQSQKKFAIFFPVFLSFFVMGFVDIVGVATNYIKKDFGLSDSMANLIPMMVFVWFAIFSIPTGMLMGRIGRKKTVLISLFITAIAMLLPLCFFDYFGALVSFALLGIGNTVLQVSLNPLAAAIVSQEKLASTLSMGQFIKAVSSFLGPVIVAFSASQLGNWHLAFLIYCIITVLSVVVLFTLPINESAASETPQQSSSFRQIAALLKDRHLVYCIIVILLIVGIDVGLNTSIPKLLMERAGLDLDDAALGTSLYFASRTIGTFIGALLLIKLSPVGFLRVTLIVAILAFAGMMLSSSLWPLLILIAVVGLACANVFSIIFTLALKHDMTHSNEISALMIMGVSGGALLSPIQGLITDQWNFTSGMSVILVSLVITGFISFKFKS
ncbi:fucose permease [Arcticibacter tournemirensis]|uniref:Sugar MFS transporter n=1 Tax=Arcticibacter tournemirensis TaxID=699437 RepID=A0A5M9H036_9SPHI|nr:MFS transporter [Arcticibacter tournemirensis]KAA8478444.1 sugar MFS transporter [Arcticibacter tournemirensis]TQM48565.1 fucose permease [Arcticibacter tournemirensis]